MKQSNTAGHGGINDPEILGFTIPKSENRMLSTAMSAETFENPSNKGVMAREDSERSAI